MANKNSFAELMQELLEEDRVRECTTPGEQAFLKEITDKKLRMESLVREALLHGHPKTVFRSRPLRDGVLEPAYEFLRELQGYLNSHECPDKEQPHCWAQKIAKIYEEYIQFLEVHSLMIIIRDSVGSSFNASHLLLFDTKKR